MPYIGEIQLFAFSNIPQGWLPCDGRTLPINQNFSLFAALGSAYGGDGRTTFALPDLRGRVPIGIGQGDFSGYSLGQKGGEETHLLTAAEIPNHTHAVQVMLAQEETASGSTPGPSYVLGSSLGSPATGPKLNLELYFTARFIGQQVAMDGHTVNDQGTAHENRMPYLALSYCMATQGDDPRG